jgi:hypothetical protein
MSSAAARSFICLSCFARSFSSNAAIGSEVSVGDVNSDAYVVGMVANLGGDLSTRLGIDVGSRSKMKVPHALPTPITPFANSPERLVAEVVGRAGEVKSIPFQYSPAPAVESHGLDRHALTLARAFPRVSDEFLKSPRAKESVRAHEFPDAEYEAPVRGGRSLCQRG